MASKEDDKKKDKSSDGLFLMEVLVDKITLNKTSCTPNKDFHTCVQVEVTSMPPLEICDDEPGSVAVRSSPYVKNFNIGKSCLFSMKDAEIKSSLNNFPVKVFVFKSLPCGCQPTKIPIGKATIDMTKEFFQAHKSHTEDPTAVSYQALKDSFILMGTDDKEAGTITMFLRITCFGKLIVTRFQGSGPPTIGTGGGTGIVDRSCNPARDSRTPGDECACGAAKVAKQTGQAVPHNPHCPAGGGGGICPTVKDPYTSMPCIDPPDDPCYCCGKRPTAPDAMACRNAAQYCLHAPKGRTKTQYEEIGTVLGENELRIKVPASASIIKRLSQTHCAMQCPFVPGGKGDSGPCAPPCGKNQISLVVPKENICCQGPRPQTTQFTCTTEGCTQASKHGQTAQPKGKKEDTGLAPKNVYVLKVAKTALQGDRKLKMEVELVTPKGGDKPLPVQTVARRQQCDPDCDCNRYKRNPVRKRRSTKSRK